LGNGKFALIAIEPFVIFKEFCIGNIQNLFLHYVFACWRVGIEILNDLGLSFLNTAFCNYIGYGITVNILKFKVKSFKKKKIT
jgi:hypothetical protein